MINVPIFRDGFSADEQVLFKKPLSIEVVGSFALRTVIKPDLNVDMQLEIPEVCSPPSRHLYFNPFLPIFNGFLGIEALKWRHLETAARFFSLVLAYFRFLRFTKQRFRRNFSSY